MGLYRYEPLIVSYHPAKCGSHRNGGSGDVMFLVTGEEDFT